MTLLAPGQRLGRFALHALLGRGGMGEVWSATLCGPEGFEKPVALKVLRAGPTDAAARQALVAEARLGARLQHPNIVSTIDLGEVDGRWLLAMERVEGCTLTALLQDAPLAPAAVVDLGLQTCAGLAHLHRAGLVHRDLKPGNLLVDRSGLVKIADLGITRLAAAVATEASGTYGYMPPEQADGAVDARSDLFALGVVLFVAITAKPLFPRGPAALAAARRVEAHLADPAFLEPADRALPGLGAVLRQCLRLDPADRYESANALASALTELRHRAAGPSLLASLAQARPELAVDAARPEPSTEPTASGTVARARGNLPAPRDRFLGRDELLDELAARVRNDRLVTLHGQGGMGKTRTALECARRVGRELVGGAWFFDLSAADGAPALCAELARGLAAQLGSGEPVAAVGAALAQRGRALFVLDNLEQVSGPAAACVSRWLELAPDAHFLATSRLALNVRGERLVPLGPLETPAAVALFRERAARLPEPVDEAELALLVEALDRLPLAIELAAARTRVLAPREIRRRLDRRLELLAGGTTDRPERQRSLRASLDGSWDLLVPWQRAALSQLATFEAGFTLEAAEAVLDLAAWPDAPWAIDVVQSLVEASLVRLDAATGRFGMLVSVQVYAQDRADPELGRAAAARHGAWFAAFGTVASLEAFRRRGGHLRHRALAYDLDNLVAACRRAVPRQDGETAVSALRAVWEIVCFRGPISTAAELAELVLAAPGLDRSQRARARQVAGSVAQQAGDLGRARELLNAAIADFEAEGDALSLGFARNVLARTLLGLGHRPEARALLAASVERLRATGRPNALAYALGNLAVHLRQDGEIERSLAHLEEALALLRETGDLRGEGTFVGNLAGTLRTLGRPRDAAAGYQRALLLHAEADNRKDAALCRINLGNVYLLQHRFALAEAELRAGLAEVRAIGVAPLEGFAVRSLAVMAAEQRRYDEARALFAQADGLAGEVWTRAIVEIEHGRVLAATGAVAEGRRRVRDALATFERLGQRADLAVALTEAGLLELDAGAFGEAEAFLARAVAILEEVKDRWFLAIATHRHGRALAGLGRRDEARALLTAAMARHTAVENLHDAGLCALDLAALEDDPARAAALLREARRLRGAVGADHETELDRRLAAA